MSVDALSTYEPKSVGKFLKFESGKPVKLRVLTLDPLVAQDKWGGTKYSFLVYNWTEDRAQIWSTTPGNLKRLTAIHRDEDLDPLNKVDIKVTANGEMLERRYDIQVMPKSNTLTKAHIEAVTALELEREIPENMGRLSEFVESEEVDLDNFADEAEAKLSGYEKAKKVAADLKPGRAVPANGGDDEAEMPDAFLKPDEEPGEE